jgi:hypothetical protein
VLSAFIEFIEFIEFIVFIEFIEFIVFSGFVAFIEFIVQSQYRLRVSVSRLPNIRLPFLLNSVTLFRSGQTQVVSAAFQ